MDLRTRLRVLLVERSLRLGEFTLASGARSSYYIDARRTTMLAEGQVLIGKVCRQAILDIGWDPTHVGGLTMGADPVSYAIAHASGLAGDAIDAFSVRKQAKEHGTRERIEGGLPRGARCVVTEDSVTTGRSALAAIEALEKHGAEVLGVLALVDREEGGRERLQARGYLLTSVFSGRELLETAGGSEGSASPSRGA